MRLNLTLLTTFLMSCNALFSQSIANPDAYLPIASFNATPSGGTYTIPATNSLRGTAITSVLVRIWGGGGAGVGPSGSGNSANIGVDAGGGGAYLTFVISTTALNSTRQLSISVGAAGQVGVSSGNGGTSSVTHNSNVFSAPGGFGGGQTGTNKSKGGVTPAQTSNTTLYTSYLGYNGGDGNAGNNAQGTTNDRYGGGGQAATLTGNGLNGSGATSYSGGGTGFGKGGNGGTVANSGSNYGGGGSGNANGASGAIYIYDFSTAALPVSLSNFTAKPTVDNKVNLSWVTASESNNKGFSIERQAEGENKFSRLGFVSSKAEGGNSQSAISYNFKDVTATTGTNTYRLIQEDLDGKQTISEVKMVRLNGQSVVSVYPNPTNGVVTINRTNDGKKMNVQILDQMGRVVSQYQNISDSSLRLNIPQSGIYQIKLMYPETGEQSLQRIVVQH